jgi:hypothetical protein
MNGEEYGGLILDVIYPMVAMSENMILQGQCPNTQVQNGDAVKARACYRRDVVATTISGP